MTSEKTADFELSESESEDEGFNEDFPDCMPFWYSSSSGKQTYAFNPSGDPTVLKYFNPLQENEQKLQKYIHLIIKTFYNSSEKINAAPSTPTAPLDKIPTHPLNFKHYFNSIHSTLLSSTKTSSHHMLGHMTSALPFFHLPLSNLITALNQNLVKLETASTFTFLERDTIHMLHSLFYNTHTLFYKDALVDTQFCVGMVCSGGTVANITALWIARNNVLKETDECKSVSQVGLAKAIWSRGYSDLVVVGSEMMHYSFRKAIDLLGLGEEQLIRIPTDEAYRIRLNKLEEKVLELIERKVCIFALVGIAGTTETGSVDDLKGMSRIAQKYGIHFHVDAAWGGPLVFSKDYCGLLNGIECADSITVDGHKQLYTPQGLGILLLKSPHVASETIQKSSQYIIRKESFDSGKFTLEGSRPANILYLHASLYLLGKHGYNVILTRSISLVKQFWVRLNGHFSHAFEPFHEPMTNILLYRYIPTPLRHRDVFTEEESLRMDWFVVRMQGMQAKGSGAFVSRTRVMFKGRVSDAFRVVVANPLTCWNDLNGLIEDQLKIGRRIELENERVSGWPFDM